MHVGELWVCAGPTKLSCLICGPDLLRENRALWLLLLVVTRWSCDFASKREPQGTLHCTAIMLSGPRSWALGPGTGLRGKPQFKKMEVEKGQMHCRWCDQGKGGTWSWPQGIGEPEKSLKPSEPFFYLVIPVNTAISHRYTQDVAKRNLTRVTQSEDCPSVWVSCGCCNNITNVVA